ncbi:MAG: glycosyltransferase family 2 protein [Lachnospiraceae bacterium]|nr:glycosyltransferase family 2 protein [Lachnospiraceae bacterium]GFI11611.1 chondroitin synthase [Lachnospiraceae bacterium]
MITIFTPIYNRAYTVHHLYESLLRQTCYDFEWLIVDDGSDDDVTSIVYQWIESTPQFSIRFYRQENRGKHCAINCGVRLAGYGIFFIVDSDDYLECDAVETILQHWSGIELQDQFAGISGLKRNKDGTVIGGRPSFKGFVDATNLERGKFGLEGDKAEVFKTKILQKFPFPEYEKETFLTEAVIWNRIAYEGYKLRWINKSLMVCEYLPDGLTAKGEQLFYDNPRGWAHFLRAEAKYREEKPSVYLKKYYHYYECTNRRFQDDEIKNMLDMNEPEFKAMVEEYTGFMQTLLDVCAHKSVCIYAYGCWGKRLKKYLDRLKIQVDYVIDKRYEEIKEMQAYSMKMNLPKVDIVFVALENGGAEIAKIMQNKMPDAEVILCRDIVPELW